MNMMHGTLLVDPAADADTAQSPTDLLAVSAQRRPSRWRLTASNGTLVRRPAVGHAQAEANSEEPRRYGAGASR